MAVTLKFRVWHLCPVFGLNNGMIPIVAYNFGARQPDRMMKTMKYSIMIAVGIMLFCLTLMQIMPGTDT